MSMKLKAVQTWAGDGVVPPEVLAQRAKKKAAKEKRLAEARAEKQEQARRKEAQRADKNRLAREKRSQEKQRKKAEKQREETKAARQVREIEIGCARFDYTSRKYKGKLIVEVKGVSDTKHISEYGLFPDETAVEIAFRTPGKDDPTDPWRLAILRKFKNPEFIACFGGRPWESEDGEELSVETVLVSEEAMIHPQYFRVSFYCTEIE